LWVAFKTGMIYVYDVNTNPWTVKKDWKAHDSPVCGLVLDPSALWTISYLQVVSLGTDNQIRLWDGMLEDDWLGRFPRNSENRASFDSSLAHTDYYILVIRATNAK
jgi:WD40 repeat protein